MAAQKTYLNTILLLSVVIVKKSVMLNVLKNFTHLTLLKTNGAAGNPVLLKRLDTTHLSLIGSRGATWYTFSAKLTP